MRKSIVYIGMDVHKETITMAILFNDSDRVVIEKIANRDEKIYHFLKKLSRQGEIKACYEASSSGYHLWRKLTTWGISCAVCAPSLIPKRGGGRRKTDRRDAQDLVRLYRAGLLSLVTVPDKKREEDRALLRLRAQKRKDIGRMRQRILKFIRLRGFVYKGKNFSKSYQAWLKSLDLSLTDELILAEYLASLNYEEQRLSELERKIEELAEEDSYREKVKRLRSLKGIDTISAMVLLTEIGDFLRFRSGRELMCYAGLVPSEESSGERRRQGKTGYTGNRHIRFIVIEAAWHYRRRPHLSRRLAERQKGQPAEVVAYSLKVQHKLYQKFKRIGRRKPNQVAVVAVARELLGFIWALMVKKEISSLRRDSLTLKGGQKRRSLVSAVRL